MKFKCNSCGVLIGLPLNHPAINQGSDKPLKVRCPKCGTVNELILNQSQITHPPHPEDKTRFMNYEEAGDNKTTIDSSASETASGNNQVGWLIVHDEHTRTQTFQLSLGKNIIGRKSPAKPCDIMIDTNDNYMSRNHSIIEVVQKSNGFNYILYDCQSTNGTFINALRKLGPNDKVIVTDGNTIQLGRTKMVLKTPQTTKNLEEATGEVAKTGYSKTIVVS